MTGPKGSNWLSFAREAGARAPHAYDRSNDDMTTRDDNDNGTDALYRAYRKLETTRIDIMADARTPSELDELRKAATAIETARDIIKGVGNARLTD